jgi:apolipoprotein N-acyltransferase
VRRGLGQPARWAALLAGALPVLAFPAPNLEFLAWVGLVPGLMLMLAAPAWREAAVRGWWFGTGYLVAALYWLVPNLGPGLVLVAIVLGILWSGVGLAVWVTLHPRVTPARAAAALLLVPSAWLVTEVLRSWQGFGGSWAVLGVSQWQHPVVLALAAVGGVWLVSFALVAANAGILIAMAAPSLGLRLIGCSGALVAIGAGPAAFALTAPSPVTRSVTIALVQPGVIPGPSARVAASERLTAQPPAARADLIVWGESSVGYDLSEDPALLTRLQALSASVGAPVLASQDALIPTGAKSKMAVLIGSHGVEGRYVKSRLVPFGEYIPFRSELGWLTSISRAAPENMAAGAGAHVLHATLRGGQRLAFGPLICFESAFPDMSRYDANHGAQVLVYQTSDSTFQGSWALEQHASVGAVRAAETGRPVVQAALTGDSAAFDPRGRTLAWLEGDDRTATTVSLRLSPASAQTPFDRLGDYVPLTAVAIVVIAAAAGLARGRPGGRAGHGLTRHEGPPARIFWTGSHAPDQTSPVPGTRVPDAPLPARPVRDASVHDTSVRDAPVPDVAVTDVPVPDVPVSATPVPPEPGPDQAQPPPDSPGGPPCP